MVTTIKYALMAGASYRDTRPDNNKFPIPAGWYMVSRNPQDNATGFEAATFGNGTTLATSTEIVISFSGTNPNSLLDPDNAANIGLATGYGSDQLLQAAEYYLQVKALKADATITLTGHSLGGGLAALIAVFFGVTAVTFDQAPFANSAELNLLTPDVAANLKIDLLASGYSESELSGLSGFLQHRQDDGGIPNSNMVSTIRVDGEFTSSLPVGIFDPIGTPATVLDHGPYLDPSIDMHSQALLTAFLQSIQSAANGSKPEQTLNEVTKKLTDLLGMIFDGNLFEHPTDDPSNENFLERLIKHEEGNGTVLQADAMITRFTSDLWKLAQDGGLILNDGDGTYVNWNNVSKALIAFAMQYYHENSAHSTNLNKELFSEISGGIQFEIADVSTQFATAFANNQKLNLSDAKGYKEYFSKYIGNNGPHVFFNQAEQQQIQSLLPYLRDWYIQAGTSGLNAMDALNRGVFMLGGIGSDTLTGGAAADLLVGNTGADQLQGGQGNDVLLGGDGNDTYAYTSGDGFDMVYDKDGQGSLIVDDVMLTGGEQYGDSRVHRDADRHLYVNVGPGRLLIDGNILIEDQQAGELGLTMSGTVAEPVAAHTFVGDRAVIDQDSGQSGIQWSADAYGNLLTDAGMAETDRSDLLTGSADNDALIGEGGRDILNGKDGNDRLYGDSEVGVVTAIANGNSEESSGQQGDWLNGGTGDDILIGGVDNDVLAGGVGADILISGAGDDLILADSDTMPDDGFNGDQARYDPNWMFSNNIDGTGVLVNVYNVPSPDSGWDLARTQMDIIYAGAGNDFAWGGRGNDVIFGEGGSDILAGNSGNDIISGGNGDDYLHGDITENGGVTVTEGNDYLDGGAQDDTIRGNGGDDILIGGTGNDTLYGGAGNDTYLYNAGDGVDYIYDNFGAGEKNVIRFGAGVDKNNVHIGLGSLLLDLGNGDAIHVTGFNQSDIYNSSSISSFEFDDGTVLTTAGLLARGFDLDGSDENDTLVGTNGIDRINGLDGNDVLLGGDGDDILNGGAGNDYLEGNNGNDTLYGGSGSDTLDGGGGADTYIGGEGTDYIRLDADDSVVVQNGDGLDAITLTDGGGTIQFNDTFAGSIDIVLSSIGTKQALVISYSDSDAVYIEDGFFSSGVQFAFSDQTLSQDQVLEFAPSLSVLGSDGADVIHGGGQADYLYGNSGDDVIKGARGGDQLDGGPGNDIYEFNLGDGKDTITDYSGIANEDAIRFGAGIAIADLLLSRVDDDLLIDISGTQDQITISNWFDGTEAHQIERVEFSGATSADLVNLLVTQGELDVYNDLVLDGDAGDDSLAGSLGNDQLLGDAGDDILNGSAGEDTLDGGQGMDSLTGGTGNDTLMGGEGDDTYYYNIGDGFDYISEASDINGASTLDTVVFGAGITAGDIIVDRQGNNIIFDINGNTGRLTISNWFAYDPSRIEFFEFVDGTSWGAAYVEALVATDTGGTAGGGGPVDAVYGTEGNDVIDLGLGDDYADGQAGNDSVTGGDGNDVIAGGAGDDAVNGAPGDDVFLYNPDDGADSVGIIGYFARGPGSLVETDENAGVDTLSLGKGISPSDVVITLSIDVRPTFGEDPQLFAVVDSHLDFNNGDGQVRLGLDIAYRVPNFDPASPYYALDYGVEQLQFVDETSVRLFELEGAINDHIRNDIAAYSFSLTYDDLLPYEIYGSDAPVGGDVARTYALTGQLGFSGEQIIASEGDATIVGTEQDDFISTFNPGLATYDMVDVINVYGGGGSDHIISNGNDIIHAGDGDDTITVSSGYATIFGGEGSNTYNVTNSQGNYTIHSNVSKSFIDDVLVNSEPDTLNLGVYDSNRITLGFGSLVIRSGEGGSIHLADFDKNDVYGYGGIETIILSDGIAMSYADFVSLGFDVDGDGDDNDLAGSNITDRINGLAGDDTIATGDGDDVLRGGTGDDLLEGGTGNDVYQFDLNDGHDVISDVGGYDQIQLGAGIMASDLTYEIAADDLRINLDSGDSITIRDWYRGNQVEAIVLADSSTLSPLFMASPLQDQSATEDSAFSFAVPTSTFDDGGMGGSLALSARLADSTPLPNWLSFDAETKTFSGTPTNDDVGEVEIKVTVTDQAGASASDNFIVAVTNTNDAPTLNNAIHDQSTNQDEPFVYQIPAATFADVDDGDSLMLSATLADGSDLQGWLVFDSVINTFSGTPTNNDAGTLEVRVTATDTNGAFVNDDFVLTVNASSGGGLNVISGTSKSEIILGTAGADQITGFGGNDVMDGGAGDDVFVDTHDSGYDTISGGEGLDTLLGGAGDDILGLKRFTGVDTVEVIDGGVGYDVIVTDNAGRTLNFSATTLIGVERIEGGNGADTITGSAGADTIVGNGGNDTLKGGVGDDLFLHTAGGGYDTISGGDGLDTLLGSAGDDTLGLKRFTGVDTVELIDGGAGYDVVVTDNAGRTLDFSGATLIGVERIEGGNGADTITGSAGADTIVGNGGNDTLKGGVGDDLFLHTAGGGYDTISGGDGLDTLLGSAGDDTIGLKRFTGEDTVEVIDGGAGYDVIVTDNAGRILDFGGTTLIGIERIEGGNGADTITGSAGADTIVGNGGSDTLKGGAGDDLFINTLGSGYDTVAGGEGIDILLGSAGDDTLRLKRFTGENTVEVIDGGAGYDVIVTDNAGRTLDFSATTLIGIERIEGGNGADTITGATGNDTLIGNGGNDTLRGGSGDDVLDGGAGSVDKLYGGKGNDVYLFGLGSKADTIHDYDAEDAQPETYGVTEDRVLFGIDIAENQLWFNQNGDDLAVSIIGTNDAITISGWYLGDAYQVDRFELNDGAYLLDNQVRQLVNAMASFNPPAFGETTLSPEIEQELQPVITASWQSAA